MVFLSEGAKFNQTQQFGSALIQCFSPHQFHYLLATMLVN
jgi:hypothetical protein